MNPDTIVIIPTYNERDNLPVVVEKILSLGDRFKILVIDDNSPDGTGQIALNMAKENTRIHAIQREGKLGLGTAYYEGFLYALRGPHVKYIFEMDADLSHDPAELVRLVEAFKDADVVIGSRYIGGIRVINWSFRRLAISKFANFIISNLLGLRIMDITTGYVGYKREVLESLDLTKIRSNGYAFQIEMKFKAKEKGFRLKEVPIIFYERREGKSKFGLGIMLEAGKIAFKLLLLRMRNRIGKLLLTGYPQAS